MTSKKSKYFEIMLLSIYIIIVIWLILFKMEFTISNLNHARNINLIPFYYKNDIGFNFHLKEVLENILIFIPLGIYLKVFKQKNQKIVLYGFIFSLLLETLQYVLAIGSSDVTDIITNTTGIILGIVIYRLLLKILKDKTNKIIMIFALIITILLLILITILLLAN